MKTNIWIVDFGSQYTQLIVRSLRELGHYGELLTVQETIGRIKTGDYPKGLILSGGPQSVFEDQTDFSIFFKNPQIAILGLCYGMQIMGHALGGKVTRGVQGEYGKTKVQYLKNIFNTSEHSSYVWMSHFDHVTLPPTDFDVILESEGGIIAGIQHREKPWLGLQFHPEVQHTEKGKDFLKYFLTLIHDLKPNWQDSSMKELCLESVKQVRGKKILCAFSGGVDSLVAAMLVHQVVPNDIFCFYVDHGMMRPQDKRHIQDLASSLGLKLEVIDAREQFFHKLRGKTDPEEKRKVIGATFIDVFEEKIGHFEKSHGIKFEILLQGTLFPDVIESISPHKVGGKSVVIKSHHNVGGLPEKMRLGLLEPLKWLFKDEVRALGVNLKLKHDWLWRHPFPGPGLSVRILGEVTPERVSRLQACDEIMDQELRSSKFYNQCWQAAVIDLGIKSVGVKGDGRAYEAVVALRVVDSIDAMTAQWSHVPYELLDQISRRITNEVSGVARVVYDITSKPPGTIEWE